ncbi:MAG TPA: low specificity L-threonine aldolase [Chthoniobacterales bacterium]|nr:low specificity L-threonine aldolase [Chthoniobacterales bacterium]
MNKRLRHFASDNNAGIYPEVLMAMQDANEGHVTGYGDDPYTLRAQQAICDLFEKECAVFFVSNGTTANCLALSVAVRSYHGVIVHEHSHIETDECNAIGHFIPGAKTIVVGGEMGKVDPDQMWRVIGSQHDVHRSKPRAISLTNATELGTVYRSEETEKISQLAKLFGLFLHVDGARFANAVASTGCSPADLTWKSGVDALSFGGTKNGLGFGEAIVFFEKEFAHEFAFRMKQSGQLASKMRFLSAPWLALLKDGLWLQRAKHANRMAETLADRLRPLSGIKLLFPTEANAVFAKIPQPAIDAMHKLGWRFYTDVGPGGGARLMCSWDTTEQDVDEFVEDLERSLDRDSGSIQS